MQNHLLTPNDFTPTAPARSRGSSIRSEPVTPVQPGLSSAPRSVADQLRQSLRKTFRRDYSVLAGGKPAKPAKAKAKAKKKTAEALPATNQLPRTPVAARIPLFTIDSPANPTNSPINNRISPTFNPFTSPIFTNPPQINNNPWNPDAELYPEDNQEQSISIEDTASNSDQSTPEGSTTMNPNQRPSESDWNREQRLTEELIQLQEDKALMDSSLEEERSKLTGDETTNADIIELERQIAMNERYIKETKAHIAADKNRREQIAEEEERTHQNERRRLEEMNRRTGIEKTNREESARHAHYLDELDRERRERYRKEDAAEQRRRNEYEKEKERKNKEADNNDRRRPNPNTNRDKLIACLMTTGASIEDAQTMAAVLCSEKQKCSSELKRDDKRSEKFQTQALTLMNNLPTFAESSIENRFEDWIDQFISCIATADFDEHRKILILASKLRGPAADTLKQLKREHPSRARSFEKIIETLIKRFHGNETHNYYADAYKRCVRLDGEAVRDYAGRVTKLFQHTYPEMVGEETTALTDVIATMLMDKFKAGLQSELRKKIINKKFKTFEDMIEYVEGYVNEEKEYVEEIQNKAHIRAISNEPVDYSYSCQWTIDEERRHNEKMALLKRLLTERNQYF